MIPSPTASLAPTIRYCLRRSWVTLTLLISACAMAWLGQGMLAQQPQQRRIIPRRPFRNGPLGRPEAPSNKPGEKRTEDPNEKPSEADDPKMAEENSEKDEKEGKKGPGNSLSIVESPADEKSTKVPTKDHEREALFVGWENPKIVFLLSGNQMGYIEPCGCAGLENQKGGLTRRITLLKELRDEKGWTVVPLDVGQNASESRSDRQQELKLQMTGSGFSKMGYQAVGIGPSDLGLSTSELAGIVANFPVVSANVSVFERATGLVPAYRIIEVGGMKIGVTQVVSDAAQKNILAADIEKQSVAKALPSVIEKLKAEKCDYTILMAFALDNEAEALAKKYPSFDLVVHGELHGDPQREITKLSTKPSAKANYVAGVGYKGMHVTVVGLFDDVKNPVRYQRVPLDARFADSKEGLQLLADYQRELKSAGLEGLGIQPKAYPGGREFVGSKACGDCHTKAYEKWLTTPHAHATETIVNPKERAGIARHHDPECLSCHVTGWNPQQYYPYTSGYTDLKKSAHLHANGCENCHGPGSKHVEAESAGTAKPADIAKLRESMRLPLANAKKKCQECHDLDNSPEFSNEGAFERYWEEVKHPWRD